MKLIVEVCDYLGEVDVFQYFKSDPDEDRTVHLTQQAESVARLAEVAKEIEKSVKTYYAKDIGLMPKALKKSDKDPSTE